MTDTALIEQIRRGDRDAAAVLVRRYYDECWRIAYRMTGHRADAEDAVQETFLRALGDPFPGSRRSIDDVFERADCAGLQQRRRKRRPMDAVRTRRKP